jgi:hypothetical protein
MTFRCRGNSSIACVLLAMFTVSTVGCSSFEGPIDLSILYAGEVGEPRSADWMEFLTGKFTRVDSIDVSRLSMETAAGADVVIIDGRYALKDNRIYLPKVPGLSRDFTKPVIMVGVAAGKTLTQMDLKLNWM